MRISVEFDPEIFNEVYLPYLECQKRWQIFFGGASSGKSIFAVAQRPIYDVLKGGRNYLIIRNVRRTILKSCFGEAEKFIWEHNLGKLFKINHSNLTITCKNHYQLIYEGLDDPQKIKSITAKRGPITDIVIEEATETSREALKILQKRLRGVSEHKKRITLIFNPILRLHWIYDMFFSPVNWMDKQRKYEGDDLSILRTTYRDNLRFLEDDDIKDLVEEKDEFSKMVYTEGIWGILGNLVFKNWEVQDLTDVIPNLSKFHNGLDFGFTNDPTALSRSSPQRTKDRPILYLTNEVYEKGLTNDLIAARILPIIGQEYVYCDAAEPKSIWELKSKYGINALKAYKGRGSINWGIQYLKQFDIIIHRELQNAINEFQLYHFKETPGGDVLNEPVDKFNHFIDATRYAHSREASRFSRKKHQTRDLKKAGIYLPGS